MGEGCQNQFLSRRPPQYRQVVGRFSTTTTHLAVVVGAPPSLKDFLPGARSAPGDFSGLFISKVKKIFSTSRILENGDGHKYIVFTFAPAREARREKFRSHFTQDTKEIQRNTAREARRAISSRYFTQKQKGYLTHFTQNDQEMEKDSLPRGAGNLVMEIANGWKENSLVGKLFPLPSHQK